MKDRIAVRVLILDDDEALLRRLTVWLEPQRCEVAPFVDPDSALEYARQHRVDVALVDLNLPGVAGVAVIERLRRIRPSAALLALSAFPTPEQIEQATLAGAGEMLHKPIRQDVLLDSIDRGLRRIGIPARNEAEFNRQLGRSLRRLREEAGLAQRDVADAAGITASQLSQIESGKTATSTWTLARIGAAMHRPLEAIFEGA